MPHEDFVQPEGPTFPDPHGPTDDYDRYRQELEELIGSLNLDPLEMARTIGAPFGLTKAFTDVIPQGQIIDFIAKQFSGKGAKERAGRLGESMRTSARGAFKDMWDVERQTQAGAGGRRSSFAMAREAKGRAGYGRAMSDIDLKTLEYEDQLRQQMLGRGMSAFGAFQSSVRGDEAAAQAQAANLIASMGPELQARGMDIDMLQMLLSGELTQQQMEDFYNMWATEQHRGPGEGGFDIRQYVPPLSIPV